MKSLPDRGGDEILEPQVDGGSGTGQILAGRRVAGEARRRIPHTSLHDAAAGKVAASPN